MAKKKKSKSTTISSKTSSSYRSMEDVDSPNDDEPDIQSSSQCSNLIYQNTSDTSGTNSNDRSSTPIIHKKFGKVICPEENDSSTSQTTDSQNEDQEDLLLYGNQMICEEVEVLTTDDVVMSEQDGQHYYDNQSVQSSNDIVQQTTSNIFNKLDDIDVKLQNVSVSNNKGDTPPNNKSSYNIVSSNTNNVQSSHHQVSTTDSAADLKTDLELNNRFSELPLSNSNTKVQLVFNSPSQNNSEIRSRSGSTDTNSSESGSTSSSSVRRSSRIKHTVQHRHREVDTSMNGSSKVPSLPPPSSPSLSLSSTEAIEKPVKVKSRWRRTSELEMVVGGPKSFQSGDHEHSDSPYNQSPIQSSPSMSPAISCDISTLGKPCPEVEEKLKTFDRIDFNIYKTDRYTNKRAKEKMICDCFLTKEEWSRGEMGCGEDCLNRLLMIECCSRCNLKDRCSNKRFQNLEYSKCEVFKTELKGFGLRALTDIQSDSFLFEYVGEVVDAKEFNRRAHEYSEDNSRHYYFMSLRPDAIIDATQKGNISRFINHSCDPNSETQKWTVDGELRIGFFSRRYIHKGEELTFDYQYQRYGKEAQKCYCGSKNCRGWIGENPDDVEEVEEEVEEEEEEEEEVIEYEEIEEEEDDNIKSKTDEGEKRKLTKVEKVVKEKKVVKKVKKIQIRDPDYVVDDPDKDLEVLCARGIKNKMDTLAVLRIIVLADSESTRYKVLNLIQRADAPCRRLIIDYHILKLLCGWMKLADSMSDPKSMKLEILETLSKLPIPDKTKLKDSNVLQVVTDWSNIEEHDSDNVDDEKSVSKMSSKLLNVWSNLVDTFRIPKKERIEQMKEHERQADRGYREQKDNSYDRTWDRYRGDIRKDDRYSKNDHRKDRKSSRESPEHDRSYRRERENYKGQQISKYEHRHRFALKVQAEDEERRKQEAEWLQHVEKCSILGLDPTNVSGFNPSTGYPVFINRPPMGTMIPWAPPTPEMSIGGTPNSVGPIPIGYGPDGTPIFPPPILPPIGLNLPPPIFPGQPPLPSMYPPNYGGYPIQPVLPEEPQPPPPPQPPLPPPIRLPKFWKTAKDTEGKIYYYNIKTRFTQWEPPPFQPPPLPKPPDDSSSDSSDLSDSSEEEEDDEDEDEFDDDKLIKQIKRKSRRSKISDPQVVSTTETAISLSNELEPSQSIINDDEDVKSSLSKMMVPNDLMTSSSNQPSSTVTSTPGRKRKREGLCTEYIISPIQEGEKQKARERKRKIKDTKEKLKQKKLEKKKLLALSSSSSSKKMKTEISTATSSTLQIESAAADTSSEPARKIKEQFRLNMAGVIVHYLNPFRKESCKTGRINNNDDFKHLARKLTHFVLVKELKHCRNVEDLECNDNVKHKAKDFIKKYMSKFGELYIREKEHETFI